MKNKNVKIFSFGCDRNVGLIFIGQYCRYFGSESKLNSIQISLRFSQPTLSAYTVDLIPSSPKSVIGEGPHWDAKSASLYYVDIYGTEYTILRHCPAENKTYGANIDGEPIVTFIIPVHGTYDQFAVGLVHSVGIIRWNGKSSRAKLIRTALTVENCTEFKNNRFNDAKADPYGRLFAGTKREEGCKDLITPTYGNLFRFSVDQPAVTLNKPNTVRISNGLAWNEKIKKMYYVDSCALNIKEYDYNPHTGDISMSSTEMINSRITW